MAWECSKNFAASNWTRTASLRELLSNALGTGLAVALAEGDRLFCTLRTSPIELLQRAREADLVGYVDLLLSDES
jgi:hypothetical protein